MTLAKQIHGYGYAPVAVPVHGDTDNGPLAERFIEVASAETVSPEAQPYLEVVARSTLPEGYTFEAESNGRTFAVNYPNQRTTASSRLIRTCGIAFSSFVGLGIIMSACAYVTRMSAAASPSQGGLRAIVTGLEHSSTTLMGALLFNAPCVIGSAETGYLLAGSPADIGAVSPWFRWNSAGDDTLFISYGLTPLDLEAITNATDFFEMYDVLRRRSHLFSDLHDEAYCQRPYQVIDKTPRYVYPEHFEAVLKKTLGVPVIVMKKDYDDQRESWNRRHGNLTRKFYDETFDNVRKMEELYPGRIVTIREEDLMKNPDDVMCGVFRHVGLEWKSEFLNMTGLLRKFSNDSSTSERIKKWTFKAGKHSPDIWQGV
jgi:hypothetical protein